MNSLTSSSLKFCVNSANREQRREIYNILKKEFNTAYFYIKNWRVRRNSNNEKKFMLGSYEYTNKEDLAKQIINDSQYYTRKGDFIKLVQKQFFIHNEELYKIWSKYNFKDENINRTVQILVNAFASKGKKHYLTDVTKLKFNFVELLHWNDGNNCTAFIEFYRKTVTKKFVNQIYQEIGYDKLIDHLLSFKDNRFNWGRCGQYFEEQYLYLALNHEEFYGTIVRNNSYNCEYYYEYSEHRFGENPEFNCECGECNGNGEDIKVEPTMYRS